MKLTCSNGQSLINHLKQLCKHCYYNTVDAHVLGTVHTYPDKFENGDFFLRFNLPFTRKFLFRAQKRSPERRFFTTLASRFRVDRREYDDVIRQPRPQGYLLSCQKDRGLWERDWPYAIYYWNCACSVREAIVLPSF